LKNKLPNTHNLLIEVELNIVSTKDVDVHWDQMWIKSNKCT